MFGAAHYTRKKKNTLKLVVIKDYKVRSMLHGVLKEVVISF